MYTGVLIITTRMYMGKMIQISFLRISSRQLLYIEQGLLLSFGKIVFLWTVVPRFYFVHISKVNSRQCPVLDTLSNSKWNMFVNFFSIC